jgi:hypothetical protein
MSLPIILEENASMIFKVFYFPILIVCTVYYAILIPLKWIWRTFFDFDGGFFGAGWAASVVVFAIWFLFASGTAQIVNGASEDQVKDTYHEVLKRDADEGGIKTYANAGMSPEEVKSDLAKSEEKKTLDAQSQVQK